MSEMVVNQVRSLMENHFKEMVENFKDLFVVQVDKDEVWELFQNSFPEGENPIFQERRRWDCACCKHFFHVMANVVAIDNDYNLVSIWDINANDSRWQPIFDALSEYIHSRGDVVEIFLHWESRVGTPMSRFEYKDPDAPERIKVGEFDHFYLDLPDKFISKKKTTYNGSSAAEIRGEARSKKDVMKRGLLEFTNEALSDTLDMICANSLYKGEEWKSQISEFKNCKAEFDNLPDECKDNFAWKKSRMVGDTIAKIRNTSIGTLLIDLSEGVDVEEAVKKYEKIVAPENYRRSTPVFTKKMLDQAKEKLIELGLQNSLGRRFAVISDINVRDILYVNIDSAKKMKGNSAIEDIFDEMAHEVSSSKPKDFRQIPEIPVDQFVKEYLPNTVNLEAYLENRHSVNMVSLIAPVDEAAPPITKWGNNFGWAYSGNVTDSLMKERVKAAGGAVEGDLRFSIQWNENPEVYNANDFDAHCTEISNVSMPSNRRDGGYEIFFQNKRIPSPNGGVLDVDIIEPDRQQVAVENIIYSTRDAMRDGKYIFGVHTYSNRGGVDGFSAEIEFDGQIFSYECRRPSRKDEMVIVAIVTLKNGEFSIEHKLPNSVSSKEVWGVTTNNFVPVSTVMYSPNYWNQQDGIGHRHYFFMLQGCKNPTTPNGFYNEFLKEDLREHRKVFEALGAKMMVDPSDDQLSGLGFSATKRNDLVVKVQLRDDSDAKVIRIKF